MAKGAAKSKDLQVNYCPLTAERWPDFEKLFGPRGACGGCWCMFWRLRRKEFEAGTGGGNRAAVKALVEGGTVPGILAYDGDEPIGWCSVSPRESFPALANSRIFQPVDEKPVWSVTCLFVHRKFRRQGVSVGLLRAAAAHVMPVQQHLAAEQPHADGQRERDHLSKRHRCRELPQFTHRPEGATHRHRLTLPALSGEAEKAPRFAPREHRLGHDSRDFASDAR